jgi:hypothetical protein
VATYTAALEETSSIVEEQIKQVTLSSQVSSTFQAPQIREMDKKF